MFYNLVRVFSSILLALMALALPLAGVQQYFCTMSMAFVEHVNDCPVQEKDCCGNDSEQQSDLPDCMVASKLIPDAAKSDPDVISGIELHSLAYEVLLADCNLLLDVAAVSPRIEQAPPDSLRLFLVQERLLI